MREIKFRGKRLDNGEWLFGDLMRDNFGGRYIYPIECDNLYKENAVLPETVGQFTGLRDKNGKEIYFGDIVRNKYCDTGKVVWFSDCSIRIDWGGGDIHFIDLDLELEGVGNIHDNPELLESL